MLVSLLFAIAATTTVPSPSTPTQYVTDTQGVLSAQTVAQLDTELASYEHATGHQVVVYIGDTTGDEPLEQWTVDTAERWGIGRKNHDDGAVLFLLMKDHKVRIEVGYGLEPYLTDAQSFWIVENTILPKMRAGDVDAAVQDGVDRILATITPSFHNSTGQTAAPSTEETGGGLSNALLAVIIFLCFFWIIIIVVFVAGIRYLITLATQGPAAAAKAWHNTWISSGSRHSSMWYGGGPFFGGFGGFGGGGFGGGGFSAGGGGFGGGGASGGW